MTRATLDFRAEISPAGDLHLRAPQGRSREARRNGGEAYVPPNARKGPLDPAFNWAEEATGEDANRRRHFLLRKQGCRPGRDQIPPARLGPQPPAATGAAPSPSSIATTAAWCPRKRKTSPSPCPATSASTCPATRSNRHPTWAATPCPACGKPARRENRHDGSRSSIRRGISPASPRRAPPRPSDMAEAEYWMKRRPVYRRHRARDPAPALSPLLRPRDAYLRPPPREVQGTLQCAVHARHGDPRDLPDAGRRTAAPSTTTPEEVELRDGKGVPQGRQPRSRSSPRPRCPSPRTTSSIR